MKMQTVYAYQMPDFKERPDLVGLKGNSFMAIANHLKDGDHVTVEVKGMGYKEVSREKGQVFIQRRYAMEY